MKEVKSIQDLRGIAAMAVVVQHVLDSRGFDLPGDTNLGYTAVWVFFVISGVIIWASSQHEQAGRFAAKRLIRIVPMYWIATLAVIAFSFNHWSQAQFSPGYILKSLLYMPFHNPDHGGQVFPVLTVGWTLNIEMIFYALFCFGLMVRAPVRVASAVLITLFVIGHLFDSSSPALQLYSRGSVLLFIAGMLLAAGGIERSRAALSVLLPFAVAALVFAGVSRHFELVAGLAAVGLVGGAMAIERRWALAALHSYANARRRQLFDLPFPHPGRVRCRRRVPKVAGSWRGYLWVRDCRDDDCLRRCRNPNLPACRAPIAAVA